MFFEHIGEKVERLEFDLVLKEIWQAIDKANSIIDENEPWKVLARSKNPIIEPEADYEINGFFGNVIFEPLPKFALAPIWAWR